MTVVIAIYKQSHLQVQDALRLWAFPIPTQVL